IQKSVRQALNDLCDEGTIAPVRVAGVARDTYYAAPGSLLPSPVGESTRILSPFDNLVIQRRRLQKLFGFDYQIECYVPEPKRKYGYFVLPVLWGDRLAARIDA